MSRINNIQDDMFNKIDKYIRLFADEINSKANRILVEL